MVNLVKEEKIAEEIKRADAYMYMEDIYMYDVMAKLKQLIHKNSTADP